MSKPLPLVMVMVGIICGESWAGQGDRPGCEVDQEKPNAAERIENTTEHGVYAELDTGTSIANLGPNKRAEWLPEVSLDLNSAWLAASVFKESSNIQENIDVDDEQDLAELSRKLENPLSDVWAIVFQNNVSINKGDSTSGRDTSNTFLFQPFLPFPVGENDEWMLAIRPVFPIVTNSVLDARDHDGLKGHDCGFGDLQVLTLLGPNRTDGWVWGLGATFKFPTASDDTLGAEKYQGGPAGMLLYTRRPWTLGIVGQHWWSYAGDSDRPETSQSEIQYIARYQFYKAWSIGMGPSVNIDWRADSGNKVTFPVGLGLTNMIKIGKVPVKIRLEAQYSVIRPDDYGSEWNIRFQVVPVIPNPFK